MNSENTKFYTGPSEELGHKLVWVTHICSDCKDEWECDYCSELFPDAIPEQTTEEEMFDVLNCDDCEYMKCSNC